MSLPRRPVAQGSYEQEQLKSFAADTTYAGSAHHKSKPADYGFHPPVNPRPSKSLCDDLRSIKKTEAQELLIRGINLGMVSQTQKGARYPKYVWAVDEFGEVYEAKIGHDGKQYHGYRLSRDDKARKWILKEWKRRTNRAT